MATNSVTAAIRAIITRDMLVNPLMSARDILREVKTAVRRVAVIRAVEGMIAQDDEKGMVTDPCKNFGDYYPMENEHVNVPEWDKILYEFVFDVTINAMAGPSADWVYTFGDIYLKASRAQQPVDGYGILLEGIRRLFRVYVDPSVALAAQMAKFSINVLDRHELISGVAFAHCLMKKATELGVVYTSAQWTHMILKGLGKAQHPVLQTYTSNLVLAGREMDPKELLDVLGRTMMNSTAPWIVPGEKPSICDKVVSDGGGATRSSKKPLKKITANATTAPCVENILTGKCNREQCLYRHEGDMTMECPQWQKVGYCKYGDACKFQHVSCGKLPDRRGNDVRKGNVVQTKSKTTEPLCWRRAEKEQTSNVATCESVRAGGVCTVENDEKNVMGNVSSVLFVM